MRGQRAVHHDQQAALGNAGRNADQPALGALRHTVIHGILDQRLQQQGGQSQRIQRRVHFPVRGQPLAQSELLNAQIQFAQPALLAQRAVAIVALQSRAQQLGHIFHRLLGPLGLNRDQAGDAVERIEQKVRAYPRAQRIQAQLQRAAALQGEALLQVGIAQHDSRQQQREQGIAQHAVQDRTRRGGHGIGQRREQAGADAHSEHEQQTGERRRRGRQGTQASAQGADRGQAQQRVPLHEQRSCGQRPPGKRRQGPQRQHVHQHHELGQEHRDQHGGRGAEVGDKEIVARFPGAIRA